MNNPEASTPHPASELARRLDGIFVAIALMINAQFRVLGPWTAPILARLIRANRRLATLLAHLAAGRLPRRHTPGSRRPAAERDALAPAPLPPLPRVHLWLVRLLGYHAAGYGSQLQTVLHDPASIAILAQLPAAGRTLRPFCRLLGVTLPAVLQLPPRRARPSRVRPARTRPAEMRPPLPHPAQPRPKSLPTYPPWYPPAPAPLPLAPPVGIDTAGIEYSFEPTRLGGRRASY